MQRRIISLVVSFIAILGIGVVAAPAALATPTGCGDLSNGQLCVNKPARASGDFETSYYRHSGEGSITVTLGAQFKNPDGTVHPTDWIASRTIKVGTVGSASRYYTTDSGWCVRGAMKSGNTTYITKWLCY
ncbi:MULTISPECIES: hypothetical protein [unclassified Streptomyces]|uniref:hypothetical protein n=1 Tax=unclassified Streptomyces TaxID=2593676 RepID=UPI0016600BC3|nr:MULTISPECIES: hypothetical protein [unclassified Streptomyces]MBD0707238.1 hypothetical protein [Streptomyces sp. CBMA291]MBD0713726.1 hypothetical protein [Streptomyces sp. CBMA370]